MFFLYSLLKLTTVDRLSGMFFFDTGFRPKSKTKRVLRDCTLSAWGDSALTGLLFNNGGLHSLELPEVLSY